MSFWQQFKAAFKDEIRFAGTLSFYALCIVLGWIIGGGLL